MAFDKDLFSYYCNKCEIGFNVKRNYEKHRKIHQIKKIYTCKVCSAKLNNYRAFQRHLHNHAQVTLYECNICKKEFSKKDAIERHLSASHQIYKVECQICGKGLTSRNDALDHLKKHHSEVDFSGCTIVDDKNEVIKLHIPCDSCGDIFLSKEDLKNHTDKIHTPSVVSYSLRKVGQGVKKKSLVNELAKKITNKNKKAIVFQCSKCHKKFQSNYHLNRHELIHQKIDEIYLKHKLIKRNGDSESVKNVSVASSVKTVSIASSVKNAIASKVKIEHNKVKSTLIPVKVTRKNHECQTCKKVFSHTYNYNRHLKIHAKQKSNIKSSNNLVNKNNIAEPKSNVVHPRFKNNFSICITPVKIPQSVKPKINTVAPLQAASFEIYPKVFDVVGKSSSVNKPKTIKNTPSGDTSSCSVEKADFEKTVKAKPYQCKICKIRFVSKEEMALHVEAKHFNKCTYCNRTFSEKEYLQAHMRGTHADKMFMCGQCDKMFVQSFHLDQHVKHVHEKTPAPEKSIPTVEKYQCPICRKFLSSASCLKRHRIFVHKERLL